MFGREEDTGKTVPSILPTGNNRSQPYLGKNSQPVEFEGKMYYQLQEKYKGKEEPTQWFVPADDVDPKNGTLKTLDNRKMILTDQLNKYKAKKKTVSQAGDREDAAPREPLADLDYNLG